MTRLFRYILTHDRGMAPCIDDDRLSLAVCKPRIRASAKVGDWVAGFCSVSGKPERKKPRGMLAYIGRVAEKLDVGEYERRHGKRADAIYRELEDGFFHRKRPEYHDEARKIRRDLRADVLVFERRETWYFGDRPVLLPDEFHALCAEGIGHKVNGATEPQIERLVTWLRERSPPGLHGSPAAETKKRGPAVEHNQPRIVRRP
jgi:hypothetical protein